MKEQVKQISWETKQAVELFEFKKKQEKENLKSIILDGIENCNKKWGEKLPYRFYEGFSKYVKFLATQNNFKFTFGKYNYYYVDMVLQDDVTYCEWFSQNVQGKTLEVLQVLDYLHKKLLRKDYFVIDLNTAFEQAKQIIPLELQGKVNDQKENVLSEITGLYHASSEVVNLSSLEDYSGEFAYYGDAILDYCDLC